MTDTPIDAMSAMIAAPDAKEPGQEWRVGAADFMSNNQTEAT